jgi:spore photoproduct lyase
MIDTIYIEEGAEELPKSREILSRFPKASVIPCKHYKEVFNPSNQSFRLQKKKPALILARQRGKLTHPIPQSYGVGGKHNFYFSHLLNCLYDCRYCFLQGMYPSAHYLLFVNFDHFKGEIKKTSNSLDDECWFFSGYDCDSLALESVTGFASDFLPFFQELPNAWIELRTKSVAIQSLQKIDPLERAVVAFSFTPQEISTQLEKGVPSVKTRIAAMQKVAEHGWKVGLRIDPILDCKDFENRYFNLFKEIFENIPEKAIHSISMGAFRMPKGFYKKIEKQYPEEALFAGGFHTENGYTGYLTETETRLKQKCKNLLTNWTSSIKIYTCQT